MPPISGIGGLRRHKTGAGNGRRLKDFIRAFLLVQIETAEIRVLWGNSDKGVLLLQKRAMASGSPGAILAVQRRPGRSSLGAISHRPPISVGVLQQLCNAAFWHHCVRVKKQQEFSADAIPTPLLQAAAKPILPCPDNNLTGFTPAPSVARSTAPGKLPLSTKIISWISGCSQSDAMDLASNGPV